jgi:hypothetical protein
MLQKVKTLELEPVTHETIWIADSAVIADQSDILSWSETGDISALRLDPKEKPAKIRFRGLTPRELRRVQTASREAGDVFFFECARYGTLSVDGMNLTRNRIGGTLGLSDDALDSLVSITAPLALLRALNKANAGLNIPLIEGKGLDTLAPCSLAEWLGIMVASLTFSSR